jgi:hypothetical protein
MSSAESMRAITQERAQEQADVLDLAAETAPAAYESAWRLVAVPWKAIAAGASPMPGELNTEPLKAGAMEIVDACRAYATEAPASPTVTSTGPATTFSEGVWLVGRDVASGTYSPTSPVSPNCYWGISVGGEVVDNDLPGGGLPTVQLEEGQEFKSTDCGTWTQRQ